MKKQNSGYVLAYRAAWYDDVFNSLLEVAIWNFLFQNAFWADGSKTFNGVSVPLKRGQIVTSVRFLSNGFRLSESSVRRLFDRMESRGMISITGTNKATILTILKYDDFQSVNDDQKIPGDQTEIKRRSNGDQTATKRRPNGDQTDLISYCNIEEKRESEEKSGDQMATKRRPNGDQTETKRRPKDANNNELENKEENIIRAQRKMPNRPVDVPETVWDDFVLHRKKKNAPLTQTALNGIITEAGKAGFSLADALQTICMRGWVGFNADWVKNASKPQNGDPKFWSQGVYYGP